MARAPSFAGVILAAGESRRMGRDKALLPWRGSTFLKGHIEALMAHTDLVIVVAGKNAAALRPLVDASGAYLEVNEAPERGQFSSLRAGLQKVLQYGRDAAVVALVDHLPVEPRTVALLRGSFEKAPHDIWMVVPEHRGQHGHPVVVGREMIDAFLRAAPTATARDVEDTNRSHIEYVPVDDPNAITSANTPEEFQQITQA